MQKSSEKTTKIICDFYEISLCNDKNIVEMPKP